MIRYGAEEFLIVLTGLDANQAPLIAQTLIEQWLADCDKALYQAKSDGRDRYTKPSQEPESCILKGVGCKS
ncbi:nucleotidyl cyclase domain-containing protein [Shewanella woodyi]|uniref:hypothetical protein n=1 Tax=Shewanella woodyi TaxID=60961 RepID=UPI00030DCF26|nr:hypothetical protein [Shewanella woodyi]